MCEEKPILPLLPGFSFSNPEKTKFHRSQCFGYKYGVPTSEVYLLGPGRSPRDIDSMEFLKFEPMNITLDPELIYGRKKPTPVTPFRPHYVHYDKTCLRFRGYFCEKAVNSPEETQRVRIVEVLYFVEDDTVTVIEPTIPNSGLPQGRLVRRSRIPLGPLPDCDYLHWKDLNLGKNIPLCGYLIHLVDCDPFTMEFLLSQGIEVNPSEEIPTDDFIRKKMATGLPPPSRNAFTSDLKLRKFLQYDGIVLRRLLALSCYHGTIDLDSVSICFSAMPLRQDDYSSIFYSRLLRYFITRFRAINVDEPDEKNGYSITYYLTDDTMQVGEIHEVNDGKDPVSLVLKRCRVPKKWEVVPLTYPSYRDEEVMERGDYFQPSDLKVGETIDIFGKRYLLHMCDNFTRGYYARKLNITQPDNFSVKPPAPVPATRPLPPYNGFGDLEDSLQSCLRFEMKPPARDMVKMMVNANKFLRYKAKLQSTHPEDAIREFVFSYSLGDSTFQIYEVPLRNSGFTGGRFLASSKIRKPGSNPDYPEYYSPQDFAIGNLIIVNEFRFVITGAELHVYSYMKDNLEKFRPEVVESVRRHLEETGQLPKSS